MIPTWQLYSYKTNIFGSKILQVIWTISRVLTSANQFVTLWFKWQQRQPSLSRMPCKSSAKKRCACCRKSKAPALNTLSGSTLIRSEACVSASRSVAALATKTTLARLMSALSLVARSAENLTVRVWLKRHMQCKTKCRMRTGRVFVSSPSMKAGAPSGWSATILIFILDSVVSFITLVFFYEWIQLG